MAFNHLSGTGIFGSDDDEQGVKLWNRIEFRRKKGWAEVRISSMEEGGRTEYVSSRIPMVVMFIGWVMDVIIECGGDDVEITTNKQQCPPECEDGYILIDGGNYEPCPLCKGDHSFADMSL